MPDPMIDPPPGTREPSRRNLFAGMGAAAAGGSLLAMSGAPAAEADVSDASYYSYGPARYVDTRTNSGGLLVGGTTRTLSIFSGLQSYTFAVNLTAVQTAAGTGYLALYSADLMTRPSPYSTLWWKGAGQIVSAFTLLDLGSAGAKVYASKSTHLIIDVVGYFYTGGASRSAPPGFAEWERAAQAKLRSAASD